MAEVSRVSLRYAAVGAREAQRQDRAVRQSVQRTAQVAQQETGTINRWMERNRAALAGIAVAAAGAMRAIIRASPTLSAHLAQARIGFELFAMQIGEDVAPATRGAAELALDLAEAYRNLDPAVRKPISGILGLSIVMLGLSATAATLETIISGTLVASGFSKLSGALTTVITSSLTWAVAIGAVIGVIGVWILKTTGVLNAINTLGQVVGSVAGGALGDFYIALTTILTLGLFPLITVLGAFITGTLEGGIPRGVERAKRALGVLETSFGNLAQLPMDAWNWGRDLISNFIAGIQSKVPDLEDVAKTAENAVRKHLSFDLVANDRMARRWGSDLVEEFAAGMQQSRGRLDRAAPNVGQQTGFAPGTRPALSGGGGSRVHVVIERGAIQISGRGGAGGGGTGGDDAVVDTNDLANEVGAEFQRRVSGSGPGR